MENKNEIVLECERCGKCCKSTFLALGNIPIDGDTKEIGKWLLYHNIEPMKYKIGDQEVLAANIPLSCKYLDMDADKCICKIYNDRPVVCKEYFCQKVINQIMNKKVE